MSLFGWLKTFWDRTPGPRTTTSTTVQAGKDGAGSPDEDRVLDVPETRVGVFSTVGNYRDHNEDNYFVPGRPSLQNLPHQSVNGEPDSTLEIPPASGPDGLFVVADGMGGQQAGERASQIAVEIIPEFLADQLIHAPDASAVRDMIRRSVVQANEDILVQASQNPNYNKMGTTVVVILLRNGLAYVAGVGDSRVYRLRGDDLVRLTEDHDLASALEKVGSISKEEAVHHRYSNVLYLYLGMDSDEARRGPDVRVIDVRRGDRFLLTTDGLTGVVDDTRIGKILREKTDPQTAASRLGTTALNNTSKDNITCVVVDIH